MNKKLVLAILLVLALLSGFYFYTKYRVAPGIHFANLVLTDLQDNPVNFNNTYKGKKLVVCFSASWCGNCWQELTTINKIKAAQLSNVEVVVISDEPGDRVLNFENRFPGAFTYLKLPGGFSSIGINSIPVTYILNPQLEVKKEHVGYLNWDDPSTLEHLKKLME